MKQLKKFVLCMCAVWFCHFTREPVYRGWATEGWCLHGYDANLFLEGRLHVTRTWKGTNVATRWINRRRYKTSLEIREAQERGQLDPWRPCTHTRVLCWLTRLCLGTGGWYNEDAPDQAPGGFSTCTQITKLCGHGGVYQVNDRLPRFDGEIRRTRKTKDAHVLIEFTKSPKTWLGLLAESEVKEVKDIDPFVSKEEVLEVIRDQECGPGGQSGSGGGGDNNGAASNRIKQMSGQTGRCPACLRSRSKNINLVKLYYKSKAL